MSLSLEKKQEIVRLQLEKRNVPTDIVLAVKMCLDVSGSIHPLFNNGTIQELVNRLIPVAMRFDDNQSLEAYAFGSDVCEVEPITPDDFDSYVNHKFIPQVPSNILWSGTHYSKALKKIHGDVKGNAPGFIRSLFGAKTKDTEPSYLMFITDGEDQGNSAEADQLVHMLGNENMYIQLIGVGNADFSLLRVLANKHDHVGFVTFPNLNKTTDEQMYETLLNDDLCNWVKSQSSN